MAEVKEEPKRRKRRKIEEQKVEEPPMTSMIDIIFQLLIFWNSLLLCARLNLQCRRPGVLQMYLAYHGQKPPKRLPKHF